MKFLFLILSNSIPGSYSWRQQPHRDRLKPFEKHQIFEKLDADSQQSAHHEKHKLLKCQIYPWHKPFPQQHYQVRRWSKIIEYHYIWLKPVSALHSCESFQITWSQFLWLLSSSETLLGAQFHLKPLRLPVLASPLPPASWSVSQQHL